MSSADKALLIAAFEADIGTTFSWTHPSTATAYTVRYLEDELNFEPSSHQGSRWAITLKLGEA
jgi:hypothetical protein